MKTLYEMTSQFLGLMNMLYDDEIDEQMIFDTCESLDYEIEDKADGYAKIIRELAADAEKLNKEEKRLKRRREALENRAEWMKQNLKASMEAIGKTKFKTELFSFGIQKNGGLAPLVIKGAVPAEYLKPGDPDSEKIRKAIGEGRSIAFAEIGERGTSLRIR